MLSPEKNRFVRFARRRPVLAIIAVILMLGIAHDVSVPNGSGLAARATIAVIDQYRAFISPRLKGRVFCRFEPTCSAYGRAAITKYGLLVGGAKTAWRIARCGPWTEMGTKDLP